MRTASKYFGLEVFVLRTRATPEQSGRNQCEVPGVTFRLVDDEELLKSAIDTALPLDDEFVRAAMDRGDLAYGAFHEAELIAYSWRSIDSAPHYDDCWIRVPRPYSYSYNSFARPEFRGQHLVPALILYSDHEMMKKGYTHRVGIIAVTNFPSLGMGKHLDSHIIGHVGFLRWFSRYLFFRSRSAADIGFQFFQPSREKGGGS
jgi:hypothetical protein